MASYPSVNAANKYARDVVAGKVIVCRYVILVCQRHLDDLDKSKSKNYPYKFSRDHAERVCRFIEKLPHTKGKWASQNLKLKLEPWQCFQFACVFGWRRKKTGSAAFVKRIQKSPGKMVSQ